MVYITVMQQPRYKEVTLEDLLFNEYTQNQKLCSNFANTRTFEFDTIPVKYAHRININKMISILKNFNESTKNLREIDDPHLLYHTFFIPKHSGGLRRIDAPNPELMEALRRLKLIFEDDFGVLYHTTAFAYIKNRSTIGAIKRHQANQSKWFAKFDLHNFFGSTTLDFVINQLSTIYPFSEIMKSQIGKDELIKALQLGFLDGGLPQGTPLSPTLTNIMMIPIDYKLSNTLRQFNNQKYIYTRYADDFQISSRYDFNVKEVEDLLVYTLNEFNAPFNLNRKKTRYGSSSGRNWNLGVMLNKDNEITIGHRKKKIFKSMLHNYITDKQNGIAWSVDDINTLLGLYRYYKMVEKDNITALVEFIDLKHNTNVINMLKEDLKHNIK